MNITREDMCREYLKAHPSDEFNEYLHVIVSDFNLENEYILSAATRLTYALEAAPGYYEDWRRLRFLLMLLQVPEDTK